MISKYLPKNDCAVTSLWNIHV